jgi:hypothetical protein
LKNKTKNNVACFLFYLAIIYFSFLSYYLFILSLWECVLELLFFLNIFGWFGWCQNHSKKDWKIHWMWVTHITF